MNKMDEMDSILKLRSEELGFKTAIFGLTIWALYGCWQTLLNGAVYNPVPIFIVITSLCVQSFSEMAMKRKMISGDTEYKEPNKILWSIIAIIAIIATILYIGAYFFLD